MTNRSEHEGHTLVIHFTRAEDVAQALREAHVDAAVIASHIDGLATRMQKHYPAVAAGLLVAAQTMMNLAQEIEQSAQAFMNGIQ